MYEWNRDGWMPLSVLEGVYVFVLAFLGYAVGVRGRGTWGGRG